MILSVIIPTWNKRQLLARTLEALAAPEAAPACQWEIVVADDGSTDGTDGLLVDWQQRLPQGRLRIVSPGRNVGRARARNFAAGLAAGRWLLFLDDDIEVPAGLLEAHLAVLREHPGDGTIGRVSTDPKLVDAPHFHYLDSRGVGRSGMELVPARYFVTQNAAVSRAAFQDVGGFDEEFSGYGFEDMELAFRLEDRAGVKFRAVHKPVPLHVHHHTLNEYLEKKTDCGRRSLRRLSSLHPDRVHEMKLDWVLDVPGRRSSFASRILRSLLMGVAGRALEKVIMAWRYSDDYYPAWSSLYYRLMDGVVLRRYLKGLSTD